MIKKPRDKGGASFKTWLYAIGRNTAIDYLRKSGKNVCGDLTFGITDDEKSLENACIDCERNIIIHHAMRNLKKEYREVLWLTYFENFGNKQTASVMKKTVHAVETLLYRARNALKTELEREGYTYENL